VGCYIRVIAIIEDFKVINTTASFDNQEDTLHSSSKVTVGIDKSNEIRFSAE
jgi:hypothetical protein